MSEQDDSGVKMDAGAAAVDAIRAVKTRLDELFILPSREKSLALTKLDEAALWAGAIPNLR